MPRKILILAFMLGIFLASLWPAAAHSADEYTLISAVVGEGGNIWLPSTIIVQKKKEMTINLRNLSGKDHGFRIDELDVQVVVPGGQTKQVTVKPTKTGVFRYYCHLHKGHVGGQLMVK